MEHHWTRIYDDPGTKDSGGQDADILWTDSTHLLVRYSAIAISEEKELQRLNEPRCPDQALGVTIRCEGY